MQALTLAALVLATPYVDTLHRFSIDLPSGWEFAPQPGDTGGAFFRKNVEGLLANATVRVLNFPQPVQLADFAARIAAAADQEAGYRLLVSQNTTLAGVPALKRRYVVAISVERKLYKIVEQRILIRENFGYVVHCETIADMFPTFEADFAKFFVGFVPGEGELAPVPVLHKRVKTDLRKLVGVWEGAGHSLHLTPSGSVILDGIQGSYYVDNGVLVFKFNQDRRTHEFELKGKLLTLSGGSFGAGQVFHKRPADSGLGGGGE